MNKEKRAPIYLGINIVILLFIILLNPEIKNIGSALHKINGAWIIAGICALFLYWVLDAAILNCIMGFTSHQNNYFKTFKIVIIGKYYSSITPLGLGGPPSLMLQMSRAGVSGSLSSFYTYDEIMDSSVSICSIYFHCIHN